MVLNLHKKGPNQNIILYNRTQSKAEALKIGTVVSTISEAVQKSEIIFICVGNDAAVSETVETILKEDVKGKLIVDCSTIHPDTTDKLDSMIKEKGAAFVAMPGKPSDVFLGTIADLSLSLRRS